MNTVEEKIINATISCIEKYGINKTTIRQIAQEAGMNSAAISYYFRSKDILMEHVMKTALHNAFEFESFKASEGLPVKDRLIIIMEGMLAGALQFPNISRAFFNELLQNDNYDTPMVSGFNEFITELEREIKEDCPDMSRIDIGMLLMQLTSSTFLFLGLFPGFYTAFPEIDIYDAKVRRDYIENLVNKLI